MVGAVLEGQQNHLRDGYVPQFGWGPIFLRAEDGALRLSTPDYAGNVLEDRTDDLSAAIATQISQMWLPSAANLRPVEVRFDQETLIQHGWQEMEDFEASRAVSKHEIYSGWFICSTEERDEPYPTRRSKRSRSGSSSSTSRSSRRCSPFRRTLWRSSSTARSTASSA